MSNLCAHGLAEGRRFRSVRGSGSHLVRGHLPKLQHHIRWVKRAFLGIGAAAIDQRALTGLKTNAASHRADRIAALLGPWIRHPPVGTVERALKRQPGELASWRPS
jgi:hypothetical protein